MEEWVRARQARYAGRGLGLSQERTTRLRRHARPLVCVCAGDGRRLWDMLRLFRCRNEARAIKEYDGDDDDDDVHEGVVPRL